MTWYNLVCWTKCHSKIAPLYLNATVMRALETERFQGETNWRSILLFATHRVNKSHPGKARDMKHYS